MSARFPVISPHGSIRSLDGRIIDRVVDGGYYEDFGAITAFELARALKLRYGLAPTVILVANEPLTAPMECIAPEKERGWIAPQVPQSKWFPSLTSPLDALFATRIARGTYAAVDLCRFTRDDANGTFAFIKVKKDGDKPPLSMSWWLSKHVQKYLDLHLAPEEGGSAPDRDLEFRQENLQAFRDILTRRRADQMTQAGR
jgi:hypothetical protein